MFKEIFHFEDVAVLTRIALVIFVAVFFASAIWIYTRSRQQVMHWANIPLEDGEPSQATRIGSFK